MDCNHNMAKPVESEGGIKDGDFVEHYKCQCGATGTIRGDASDPPQQWARTGRVFNE